MLAARLRITRLLTRSIPLLCGLACSSGGEPVADDSGSGGAIGSATGGSAAAGGAAGGSAAGGRAPVGGQGSGGSAGGTGLGGSGPQGGGTGGTGGTLGAGGSSGPAGGSSNGMGGSALSSGGATPGGGTSGSAGGSDGGPGASTLADTYPCNSETSGYDAVVTGAGASWSVNGEGGHSSLLAAMRAALGSGGTSANAKRKVLLVDSGTIPANEQLRVPSNTLLNACGTITVVEPTGGTDRSPLYARSATSIDVPHVTIRGVAQYGAFFRETDNIHLGIVDIRLSGGLGIRVDNNPGGNDWGNSASNAARRSGFRADDVYVENVTHGLETYGIRDITVGRIVARNTSEAGLMLNNSVDVEVGLVDGKYVSPNAGYAVFRMANDNGKDWDSGTHPMNIHVKKVIARESGGSEGQGIFCLTDSGGVTIDEVDLENTASSSIWLEWCTNVVIGSSSAPSRVVNSGDLMISYGTSTRMSDQLLFQNITLTNTNVNFNQSCPPDIQWLNVTRGGSAVIECQ